MDFETWDVDLASGEARHESGCVIRVEGDPESPSSVDPSDFPKSLSFVDQARLLRCGVDAIAKEASASGHSGPVGGQSRSVPVKSRTARDLEQQAKMFADNPDKPKRSVLSLKKPRKESVSE